MDVKTDLPRHAPRQDAEQDETGLAPLIEPEEDSCLECWTCVRLCPAKAIKFGNGHPEIITDRCVSCGSCVTACSNAGYVVRDDTEKVRKLLAASSPVVALLATESVVALHPLAPTEVEERLEAAGFYSVESTLLGEEMVAREYEELCSRSNGLPVIRSTCPVVVEWVRRFRPALAQALAPVVPPYIAQARLIKRLYAEDVSVVYVGPCFARKDEAFDESYGGAVDAALDFAELFGLITHDGHEASEDASQDDASSSRSLPWKELSLTDGFPRSLLEERTMVSTDIQVARGLSEADGILDAIERGDVAPGVVDLLGCDGCVDGPTVRPDLTLYAKKDIDIAERRSRAPSKVSNRELLGYLPEIDLTRSIEPAPVEVPAPSAEEIDAILSEGGFASRDEAIDCGACGYRACVDLAVAIHLETATWDLCFPLQRRRLTKDIEDLAASASTDPVTGLWNRSALSERMDDEVSRRKRYGTPVSLLMLDLDSFKRINDVYGHLVGDQLLSVVGQLLSDNVRASDFAARFGGDEFAVVLPGTTKTEAYAVAEKIRTAVASLKILPKDSDSKEPISTTVSIGVAAAGDETENGIALLDAADRALYGAKEAGRDQVRLAPD